MLPYTVFWIKSHDFKQYPKLKIQGSAAGRGVTPDLKSFGAEKNFNDLAGFVDAVRVSSFVDSVRLRQRIARDPNQAVPLILGHLMRRQKSTWMLMLGPFAWEKAWLCKGVPDLIVYDIALWNETMGPPLPNLLQESPGSPSWLACCGAWTMPSGFWQPSWSSSQNPSSSLRSSHGHPWNRMLATGHMMFWGNRRNECYHGIPKSYQVNT